MKTSGTPTLSLTQTHRVTDSVRLEICICVSVPVDGSDNRRFWGTKYYKREASFEWDSRAT